MKIGSALQVVVGSILFVAMLAAGCMVLPTSTSMLSSQN
jgi:hypothetical protein